MTETDAKAKPAGERPPRQHPIVAGAEPIKLGSMLVTLVEPRRGHEIEYNRWYERDHFYAGCMIGPYQFAGKRFVATAELKALRDPDPSSVTGEPDRGSFLSIYWVLDGYHDTWNRWAVDQVKALHKAGRMFNERDHVHTLLYRYAWERGRDADGLPAELALDHPSAGLVAVFTDRAEDLDAADYEQWIRDEHLPALLPGTPARLVIGADPLPLLIDAPGDVPRSESDDRRQLTLWFLDSAPQEAWDSVITAHRRALEASGKGRVVAALPFIPTIPGTDTYTDMLWADQGDKSKSECDNEREVFVSSDPTVVTPPARRFDGKTAIVTGAGSGIGRATAIRLAGEGASVACLDVVPDNLDETVEALSILGGKAVSDRCDVTDENVVNETVTEVASTLGRPDVLCNVAGIGTFAHTAEMPLAQWERILAVNLTGTFLMSRAALGYMLEPPGGSIVNIASTAGLMGSAYSAAYAASKGGVIMFTKALAIEYAGRGVRINAVAPGGVDTPLLGSFSLPEGGDMKHIYRITSRMGFCTPDQITAAIAFLASDESAYTTGAVLAVDGGITA